MDIRNYYKLSDQRYIYIYYLISIRDIYQNLYDARTTTDGGKYVHQKKMSILEKNKKFRQQRSENSAQEITKRTAE